jgi:hypothetical protein
MTSLTSPLFLAVAIIGLGAAVKRLPNVQSRPVSTALLAGYALIFGLAPLVNFWEAESGSTLKASFASLLGLFGLFLGMRLGRLQFGEPEPIDLTSLVRTRYVLLACTLLGVSGLLMFAYGSAGSLAAYMASGRFEYRLNPRSPLLAATGAYFIPFLGIPGALLTWARSASVRLMGLAVGLSTTAFLFSFYKGARAAAVGILLTVVFAWLASPRRASSTGHSARLRVAVGMAVGGAIASLMLPVMYQARTTLASEGTITAFGRAIQETYLTSSTAPSSTAKMFEREPLNYADYLVEATEIFPQRQDFLWVYPLRRLLFFYLPSGGAKPPDTNEIFAQAAGRVEGRTTIPPSLVGEGYIVFGGLFGVLPWVALYGVAVAFLEARLKRPVAALVFLAVGFSTALLALRGQLYELGASWMVSLLFATLIIRAAGARRARGSKGRPACRPEPAAASGRIVR